MELVKGYKFGGCCECSKQEVDTVSLNLDGYYSGTYCADCLRAALALLDKEDGTEKHTGGTDGPR